MTDILKHKETLKTILSFKCRTVNENQIHLSKIYTFEKWGVEWVELVTCDKALLLTPFIADITKPSHSLTKYRI
jgi:hypothetical protein